MISWFDPTPHILDFGLTSRSEACTPGWSVRVSKNCLENCRKFHVLLAFHFEFHSGLSERHCFGRTMIA